MNVRACGMFTFTQSVVTSKNVSQGTHHVRKSSLSFSTYAFKYLIVGARNCVRNRNWGRRPGFEATRNPLNPLSQQNSFRNFLLALRMDTLIGYKRRQETHRQPSYPQRSLPLVGCRSKAKCIAREVFWNARNFNCAQPPLYIPYLVILCLTCITHA